MLFGMQGKGIDCLATHPGIADTRLYSKLDTAGKLEAKGLNAFKTVCHPSGFQSWRQELCPDNVWDTYFSIFTFGLYNSAWAYCSVYAAPIAPESCFAAIMSVINVAVVQKTKSAF